MNPTYLGAADVGGAREGADDLEELDVELVVIELDALTVGGAGAVPAPQAAEVLTGLRAAGMTVALVTSLSEPATRGVLDAFGWQELADLVLWPAIAGRGRPYPDIPLTAVLRAGVRSATSAVLVGGSVAGIRSGVTAGLGANVGVLGCAADERALMEAGADAVVDSLADLPALLGIGDGGDVAPHA